MVGDLWQQLRGPGPVCLCGPPPLPPSFPPPLAFHTGTGCWWDSSLAVGPVPPSQGWTGSAQLRPGLSSPETKGRQRLGCRLRPYHLCGGAGGMRWPGPDCPARTYRPHPSWLQWAQGPQWPPRPPEGRPLALGPPPAVQALTTSAAALGSLTGVSCPCPEHLRSRGPRRSL